MNSLYSCMCFYGCRYKYYCTLSEMVRIQKVNHDQCKLYKLEFICFIVIAHISSRCSGFDTRIFIMLKNNEYYQLCIQSVLYGPETYTSLACTQFARYKIIIGMNRSKYVDIMYYVWSDSYNTDPQGCALVLSLFIAQISYLRLLFQWKFM